ncbi:MAG TPA: AMP-binding protein [Candidatus Limnocylindrales bacterium]|nr:AMP-binding protein [Candidatus Limnocylindrales bacterium]
MATTLPAPSFARADAEAPWRPTADAAAESRLAELIRRADADDLEDLQARAVRDPAWFWGAAVEDLGLRWQRPWSSVLEPPRGAPFARWWSGGAFNHAVAATEPWAERTADAEALAWEGEDGEVRRLTFGELDRAVRRASAMLAANGIGEGTRVGIFLPMLPETAVAVLALGRLRAVFSPIFSGYAAPAVATRLRAFEATHLLTADGFRRRGGIVELKATADAAVAEAPSVGRVIVVRRLNGAGSPEAGRSVPWDELRDRWWDEGLPEASSPEADGPPVPATDPETPYMVIYTSGTTGAPKGTVHVHGGFPIKAADDLAHTFDLRAGDGLFWFTDLGWMMGPWAISGALLLGARVVMYEGAPDFPDPGRLWAVAARHRATHLGVSPTLVRALLVHGTEPVRSHDLSALRVLGSTGEPWNPDPWRWYFETVGGARLPIVNYSGGTEVSGGILGCNVLRPIRPTSFNGPCPGMAADVVDAEGRTLVGAVGELAIRAPWPGMTRSFWPGGAAEDERYLETYWARQPGLWVHGDWALRDGDGFWYLHGRSDDTLKVAGKRVGPAEVEAAAVAHPAVVEAAAIGVPDELKGEAIVVLCVVRRDARVAPEELAHEVTALVVRDLGKPTRPAAVVAVPELPRTRSGKIMRRVARAAWLGLDGGDISALENPAAVEAIAAVAATRG